MRLPALMLVLLAAGCAQSAPAPTGAAPPVAAPIASGGVSNVALSGSGEFAPDSTGAIVYDRTLTPEGAQASVTAESRGGKTLTSLVVEGFLPNHRYGAHLHTNPCGPRAADAGGHYQHQVNHASRKSEVWLDVTTDASGAGRATARQKWAFDPVHPPRALVIHASPTKTKGIQAGTAGARIACLTLS
jgi:Cu-Zn family superoxide dismutase